jgi:hypothetical protein
MKKLEINEKINLVRNECIVYIYDAKIDIYTNEDDNKDLPAYSQVSHLCLII